MKTVAQLSATEISNACAEDVRKRPSNPVDPIARELFEIGEIADYRHGGKLKVIFVDHGCRDRLPYQCCLPDGDPTKNAWFSQADLRKANRPT